jgi:hypothetical protein
MIATDSETDKMLDGKTDTRRGIAISKPKKYEYESEIKVEFRIRIREPQGSALVKSGFSVQDQDVWGTQVC